MDKVPGCEACIGIWRWAKRTGGASEGEVIVEFFNFSGTEHTIQFNAAESSPVTLRGSVSFIVGQSKSMAGLTIEPWSTIVMAWR